MLIEQISGGGGVRPSRDRRTHAPQHFSDGLPHFLQSYRFTVDWRRVAPGPSGMVSTSGLDFYDRLVDELLHSGLNPLPTFDQWHGPPSVVDDAGWLSRQTVAAFNAHVQAVVDRLGDRIDTWTTLNEPVVGAPRNLGPDANRTVTHHVLLAHGMAVAHLRSVAPAAQVAVVLNFCATMSPAIDNAVGFAYADAIAGIDRAGLPADVPADDLALISQPIDLFGISCPITGWDHDSDVFVDLVRSLHQRYHFPKLLIVEDGTAMPDSTARRLRQSQTASELGIPIVGYLV